MAGPSRHYSMEVLGRRTDDGPIATDDKYCQPCASDGDQVNATGFCKQCKEFICQQCTKWHRRNTASKHHDILQGDDMPSSNSPRDCALESTSSETCHIHTGPGSILKFYCRSHDEVGCGDCLFLDHQSCPVEYITDVADTAHLAQEINTVAGSLESLSSKVDTCESNIQDIFKTNTESSEKALGDLERFKCEFVAYIDRQAKELRDRIDCTKVDEEKVMNEVIDECLEAKRKAAEMKDQLGTMGDDKVRIFAVTKRLNTKVKQLQHNLKDIEAKSTPAHRGYTFTPDPVLVERLVQQLPIGTLDVEAIDDQTSPTPVSPALDITTAKVDKIEELDIPCMTYNNAIFSMSLLVPNRLVLADCVSSIVVVVDMATHGILAHEKLTSVPRDVTAMSSKEFAVSLPHEEKIRVLAFQKNKLYPIRDFKVYGVCLGVDYNISTGLFLVTFVAPKKVEILDQVGHVLTRFSRNNQGKDLFRYPSSAIFSMNGEDILVADYMAGTITRLAVRGEIRATYKPPGLFGPRGMSVCDDDGRFMVCGQTSNSIPVLSRDGRVLCELLLESRDDVSRPCAVVLSDSRDMLYVATAGSKYLKVYRLTQP